MDIQQRNVFSMSVEQLISFGSQEFRWDACEDSPLFAVHYWEDIVKWVKWFVDEKPRKDFSSEAIRATLKDVFPDEYTFDGDIYVVHLETYQQECEEATASYEEIKNLPLIGKCKFYPTLSRIIFVRVDYYEDSNILNTSGYTYQRAESVGRISVQDYSATVQERMEAMKASLDRLNQPAK